MQRQSNGLPFCIVIILIVAFLILALLVSTPAWAQEARWKELDAQVDQLQKQGKNREALRIAEEASDFCSGTRGFHCGSLRSPMIPKCEGLISVSLCHDDIARLVRDEVLGKN